MIYKLNNLTGEITQVSSQEAERALRSYGWTDWSINDFFRSAKVLCDHTNDYCRFRDRLEDLRRDHQLNRALQARGLSPAEVSA